MEKETTGTVVSVSKQWWLKVNTKPIRMGGPLDGAAFPHIVKVQYTVDGQTYIKRKWIGAGLPVPSADSRVRIVYEENKPSKAKIMKFL